MPSAKYESVYSSFNVLKAFGIQEVHLSIIFWSFQGTVVWPMCTPTEIAVLALTLIP